MRDATESDVAELVVLETLSFPPDRQASRRSIRHSVLSPHQRVRVVRRGSDLAGASTLFIHPLSLRLYSLAVHPDCRSLGLGRFLVADAADIARSLGKGILLLEADPRNPMLVSWYEHQGFVIKATLADYYAPGNHAVRMTRTLEKGP